MLSFVELGKGEQTVVFLHGWAKKKEDYSELLELLAKHFKVYALDLPGFGQSAISRAYSLDDYADDVAGFMKENKISGAVFVGHSFGGRVAIKLAVRRPELVSKLVLIDSGGIERKTLKVKLLQVLAALTPTRLKELVRPMVGSRDYLQSVGLVRETMKKVVAENLENILPTVGQPTLLIWGEGDHTTPLWQGKLMHELIKNSQFKVIAGDHGIPYRKAKEVANIICSWL